MPLSSVSGLGAGCWPLVDTLLMHWCRKVVGLLADEHCVEHGDRLR